MVIDGLDAFNKLAETCENKYVAVKFISRWARTLGQQYSEYQLLESKLIQWVITGVCPYTDLQMTARYVRYDPDGLDELLEWVTDETVLSEVKALYKKSINSRKLLHCHNPSISPGKATRIDILLRMIWYSNTTNLREENLKMNEYLSTLVRKGSQPAESVQPELEVVHGEPVAELEPVVNTSEITESDTNSTETTEEIVVGEPVSEEDSTAKEEPIVEESAVSELDDIALEPVSDNDNTDDTDSEKSEEKYDIGAIIPVKSIKVFNIPDSHTAFQVITGNVVYLGEAGELSIIEYMRPGFGLVRGYTLELL